MKTETTEQTNEKIKEIVGTAVSALIRASFNMVYEDWKRERLTLNAIDNAITEIRKPYELEMKAVLDENGSMLDGVIEKYSVKGQELTFQLRAEMKAATDQLETLSAKLEWDGQIRRNITKHPYRDAWKQLATGILNDKELEEMEYGTRTHIEDYGYDAKDGYEQGIDIKNGQFCDCNSHE